MSLSAVSVLSGDLSTVPIRSFIQQLTDRHALGLTPGEVERSTAVLQEQWFNNAEEMRALDADALGFLPLPKQLPNCILAFFSPNYNPNQSFAPGSHASSSSKEHQPHSADAEHSQPPAHTNGMTGSHSAQQLAHRSSVDGTHLTAPASSSSSSSLAAPPATYSLDLAALEGGITEGNGEGSREVSLGGEGGGSDGSSSDADSGSEDSGHGSGDEQLVDGAPAQGHRKKKKKWDRHSSLLALKKAVDHVCNSSTKDENVLSSLQNILRAAMQKSGKHTQNTLRELMKKLQDKQASVDVLPDVNAGVPQKSMSTGANSPPPALPLVHSNSFSSPSTSSSGSFGFSCGICHGSKSKPVDGVKPKPVVCECGHKFDATCLTNYILDLVGQKQAVGIMCPYSIADGQPQSCDRELSTATIQSLLQPSDFANYLDATLMSFIESDDCMTVTCPNKKCGSIMTVEPLKNPKVPNPITEVDEEGRVLTKETYLHFIEFRVRCRDCNINFCAKCLAQPYHKGMTCVQFKEYEASRHCRFCSSKLPVEQGNRLSNGVKDVCQEKECQEKSLYACEKTLQCGCPCGGIKNESSCLPCLKHDLKIEEDEYCGICYVEGLKDAPCIKLEAPCVHVFHFLCVKQKLEARWPNARIGFEFKCCPLCKSEIKHKALESVLAPINLLEEQIKEKSLQRLKFECRDKDPAIVNANGAYFNDPIGFAMKQYLFYICHTCKRPYFAGGYQCQEAGGAYDPAELVCPACQPSSVENCPTHGADWLAFKCRYCCSFANWTCWGSTHFCDKCHKSGVWQTLAVFRTGKNKKKLWEYEQCPTLQKQVDAIGRENGTEEEKNAKLSKLLCAPRSCPLGVRHPPNGLEFGLGCSMCEDRQSIGDAQARVEAVRAKLSTVKTELASSPRTFTYREDFDLNGVFYYLGTCGLTQPWSNPAEAGFVKIGCSAAMADSAPLSALVGRDLVRLVSQPQRNSWFSWELIDLQLCLTRYTLKHYNSWDTECLRHWTIEGSNDGGAHWEFISSHANDVGLNKKGGTCTWEVDSRGRKYRMFRILQTGRNSNNNFYLALSGSEFYGELSLAPIAPTPQMALTPSNYPAGRQTFVPKSDFDTNGFIHWLGMGMGKSQTWRNPAELGLCIVACSELAPGPPPSEPTSAVVGKNVVRCVSVAKPNQWFVIDITPSGKKIKPSHYSLRHYSSWDLEALRNWRFEGSADGLNWFVLSVHMNDASLDRKGATHTWALPGCTILCSMFRIWQTGLNSNNHHYLALSGFEVYGVAEDATNFPGRPQPLNMPGIMPPHQWPQSQMVVQPQIPPPYHAQPPPPAVIVPAAPHVPNTPMLPMNLPGNADSGMVVLKYTQDFDMGGLMFYLGSQGRRTPWRNPADAGLLKVTCSELAVQPPSMPANVICGQEAVRCCTVGKPDMYYIVDLKDKYLAVTHYSIRHYTSWDTECLRNWKLEGSINGLQWDIIRLHRDDRALNGKGSTATWTVPDAYERFYKLFKITQIGPNSNNNHYLALSCLEFYGILQLYPLDGRDEARKAASLAAGFRGQTVEDVRSYQQELKDGGGPKKVAGGMLPEAQRAHEVPHQQAALMPPVASQSVSPLPVSLPSVPQSAVPAGAGGGSKFGPPPYRPFEDGMEFIYQQDLDANGILYWLGTQRWTRPWQNPAELGVVQVTSVPLAVQPKSEPASAIVGRSLCRCVTLPNRESWFIIDLINVWVRPTAYTLRHYDSFDTEALRDWKLQGSNDGKKWTKLLSHKKDESLNAKGESHTWAIPKPKKSYRMFRILQTGKNSNNHWYCALSSIELYGKVYSYKR